MYFQFLSDEQNKAIDNGIRTYRGHGPTLESALGAVMMGHMLGWRYLKLMHSPATYRKYERLLGIKFEEICTERGELAHKSVGMQIADKLNSFWAVATGKRKVKDKSRIASEEEIKEVLKDVQ